VGRIPSLCLDIELGTYPTLFKVYITGLSVTSRHDLSQEYPYMPTYEVSLHCVDSTDVSFSYVVHTSSQASRLRTDEA